MFGMLSQFITLPSVPSALLLCQVILLSVEYSKLIGAVRCDSWIVMEYPAVEPPVRTSPGAGFVTDNVGVTATVGVLNASDVPLAPPLVTRIFAVASNADCGIVHAYGDCAVLATIRFHVLPPSIVYSSFAFGPALPPVAQTILTGTPDLVVVLAFGRTIHAASAAVIG